MLPSLVSSWLSMLAPFGYSTFPWKTNSFLNVISVSRVCATSDAMHVDWLFGRLCAAACTIYHMYTWYTWARWLESALKSACTPLCDRFYSLCEAVMEDVGESLRYGESTGGTGEDRSGKEPSWEDKRKVGMHKCGVASLALDSWMWLRHKWKSKLQRPIMMPTNFCRHVGPDGFPVF